MLSRLRSARNRGLIAPTMTNSRTSTANSTASCDPSARRRPASPSVPARMLCAAVATVNDPQAMKELPLPLRHRRGAGIAHHRRHDGLLGGLAAGELGDDAALAHHQDAITHAHDL